MYYSDEQIERAKSRRITEYFRSIGYSCDREGREIHIHGFGGLKVKEDTQEYYIHSRHVGGVGLISCLMTAFEISFPEAVREALNGEEPGAEYPSEKRSVYILAQKKAEEVPKPLLIPERAADNRRIYAYLSKERCISPVIISELVKSGLLYQDTKGNAVFLHRRDNIPCGAEIHGTGRKKYIIGNTNYADIKDKRVISVDPCEAELLGKFLKNTDITFSGYVYSEEANIISDSRDFRIMNDMADLISDIDTDNSELQMDVQKKLKSYKGVCQGTTDSYFEYIRSDPEKAYVFESAIDLMSFMQLHPEADNCKFIAMAGLKNTTVEKLLSEGIKVVLCVDNDKAGMDFCERFTGRCSVFTECRMYGVKDFNELLQIRFPKKDFVTAVRDMAVWAEKVKEKSAVSKEVRHNEAINRNRSLET